MYNVYTYICVRVVNKYIFKYLYRSLKKKKVFYFCFLITVPRSVCVCVYDGRIYRNCEKKTNIIGRIQITGLTVYNNMYLDLM